jgi:hypothetical protein
VEGGELAADPGVPRRLVTGDRLLRLPGESIERSPLWFAQHGQRLCSPVEVAQRHRPDHNQLSLV